MSKLTGAQAGRNGGGRVLAKVGAWSVHSIIPKEQEWLLVLVCLNTASYYIPSFYIFCGKSFQRDYIKQCEDKASMAIQEKAWMTGHLVKSWIGLFVKKCAWVWIRHFSFMLPFANSWWPWLTCYHGCCEKSTQYWAGPFDSTFTYVAIGYVMLQALQASFLPTTRCMNATEQI